MKVIHRATAEEIAQRRKQEYLTAWPVEKQLEAITEAQAGRPEKQQQMLQDFANIREALPYHKE
ncbi:MAG: hypothetical protein IJT79_01495 [Ruminococcus sp.]|nr:hypothetical protein [Ruminococcus sp.]